MDRYDRKISNDVCKQIMKLPSSQERNLLFALSRKYKWCYSFDNLELIGSTYSLALFSNDEYYKREL